MDSLKASSLEISKRRNSAILISCIYSAQFTTTAVIYNLNLVSRFFLTWTVIYYLLTFLAAIPQSGFSDFYGRKKHLMISSMCVLLSAVFLSLTYITKLYIIGYDSFSLSFITVLPACLLLGVAGNAIPIARAGIADLKVHDFRTAMGWSTTFIGFGWITAIMLGFIFSPLGVLIAAMLFQVATVIVIKLIFSDTEDSSVKASKKPDHLKSIFTSYYWFYSMFLVTGGAAAILAYLFTETAFYQIYSLDEEGVISFSTKVAGLVMAFGYASGVIVQWIISCSDKVGIKFGISFSLFFLLLLVFLKITFVNIGIIFVKSPYFIEGACNFLFAFGFGFSVPSLFSLMSSKIESHHAGRLFGAIDTTDTVALSLSSLIFYLKDKLKLKDTPIYILLLLVFMISFIFYRIFIKRFSTYEKKH